MYVGRSRITVSPTWSCSCWWLNKTKETSSSSARVIIIGVWFRTIQKTWIQSFDKWNCFKILKFFSFSWLSKISTYSLIGARLARLLLLKKENKKQNHLWSKKLLSNWIMKKEYRIRDLHNQKKGCEQISQYMKNEHTHFKAGFWIEEKFNRPLTWFPDGWI